MLDTTNRTFICSVVFIDLVGYSKKPVTEQIRLKTSLTNNLSEAIKDIPINDRIILDTGDGAAISFLGDPEDALFVTLSLREAMMREGMTATMVEASGDDSVRMGINLGPVKLVKDINGHPNIIGDGINVAQRIMSFARPGQIVVSRSYYDVVSNLASEYAKLFSYEGSRTDKHVREHEIYVVGHHEGALQKAKDGMKDRASSTTPNARRTGSHPAPGSSTVTLTIPGFVQDKKKLTMVAGGLALVVLVLGILVATKKPSSSLPEPTVASAPAVPLAPAAAPKPLEPAKPAEEARAVDSRVLSPAPSAGQIPSPAPAFDPKDATKAPARAAEPVKTAEAPKPADASKAAADAAAKAEPKPGVIPATVFLNIDPWGEIYVNGKSQGVSPPRKFIKLEPGKYKIEIRNTTFPAHVQNVDLKSRDETTLKHKFQ
ncbi:MAG TPA: adenylate/guanylate cyclase domain-containing protein [Usitatibacter sp.]|nr:adenylate/guanylate cyclase domain-containing protein [Usitatibacter sp.]